MEMCAAIKGRSLSTPRSKEQLRVTSKSKDELQQAMALLRSGSFGVEVQFKNFR